MSWLVFYKLLAIFITVVLGWFVGRMRWLEMGPQADRICRPPPKGVKKAWDGPALPWA